MMAFALVDLKGGEKRVLFNVFFHAKLMRI